jgi:hypothetical protein
MYIIAQNSPPNQSQVRPFFFCRASAPPATSAPGAPAERPRSRRRPALARNFSTSPFASACRNPKKRCRRRPPHPPTPPAPPENRPPLPPPPGALPTLLPTFLSSCGAVSLGSRLGVSTAR